MIKIVLKEIFGELPTNVITAIEKKEGMSIEKIIEIVSTLPRLQIKDEQEAFSTKVDFDNHLEYLEESIDTIHALVAEAAAL